MEVFLKPNVSPYSDSLLCEAHGLDLLRQALRRVSTQLRVPEVLQVDETQLRLPRIAAQAATPALMAVLGEGLALLHQQRGARYGFADDNYIGLAPQVNGWSDQWGQFFIDQRLRFQIARIADQTVRESLHVRLEALAAWLVDFLDQHCEHPSLLHGDLWSGNVLFDARYAWLIDPAVYYGDREADLAMTEFFGGFSEAFRAAYARILPLSDTYPLKRDIYNLYHALNHYNLFGSTYLGHCRSLLQRMEQGVRSL